MRHVATCRPFSMFRQLAPFGLTLALVPTMTLTTTNTAIETPSGRVRATTTTTTALRLGLLLEVIEEAGAWDNAALEGWGDWLGAEVARAVAAGAPEARVAELRVMAEGVELVLSARRPVAA